MNKFVSASVVLYKTNPDDLKKVLGSFMHLENPVIIYLIDNSPTDVLRSFANNSVVYIHNPSNPGFGASHNVAIQKARLYGSQYHFIINPDIYFKEDVITPMVDYMNKDSRIGMMMPQILNEDGTVQNLPKLLPSPFSILMRKFNNPNFLYDRFIKKYELRNVPNEQIYEAPILSGCFTLLNLEAIKKIGGYDDRFFMYFEDWDLSRRMHQKYKTVYFPKVSVVHGYESGANKSKRLFKIFIKSAFTYFNKWGWFWDRDRDSINKKTLAQFK